MKYLTLSGTGIKISAVAMGCWGIMGGRTWGERDDELSIKTIKTAYEHGINFFDTAYSYGHGESEKLLGKAVQSFKNDVVIASKISIGFTDISTVRFDCENALKNLRRDYIDLYQIHWHNQNMPPIYEIIKELEKLKKSGKILAIGVCNMGAGQLNQIPLNLPVVINQMPYSLLWRAIEHEIIPVCKKRDMKILAYSPLMQGLLTGKFNSPCDVPDGRARTKHFGPSRPEVVHSFKGCETETFNIIQKLVELADEINLTISELAIAWLLSNESINAVIAGARKPEQAVSNAKAVQKKLSAEIYERVNKITEPLKNQFGNDPDMWRNEGRIF